MCQSGSQSHRINMTCFLRVSILPDYNKFKTFLYENKNGYIMENNSNFACIVRVKHEASKTL